MNNKPVYPIKRMDKFYSEYDFMLEEEMVQEVLSDVNQSIVLFRVDSRRSEKDVVYGEGNSNSIFTLPPIEVRCLVRMTEPENKAYGNDGTIRYLEKSNLEVQLLIRDLNELRVDINFGDYLAFNDKADSLRFYSVSNDGRFNYHNSNMRFGYKESMRKIIATPIDDVEFKL